LSEGGTSAPGRERLLLLVCFLLSGFAALVYQTAWTRQFAFVFGTSELAVATVLAAYMGGLAAGAAVAARFANRVRRPVLWYGLLELGIALTALAVPFAVRAAQSLYVVLFRSQQAADPDGLTSAVFFLLCSFAILMVPTGLMGATLPLLARHAVRRESEIGSGVGTLYAVNTAGAVAGTLLAAFWLLPALGLGGTVYVAAALNAGVFAAAALLARVAPAPPGPGPAEAHAAGGARWILPLILLSGAASFSYEVLWTRLLSHLVGGSVYAFATMLASFLIGIAVGSVVASRRAGTREAAAHGFAWAQIGTACLSLAAYAGIDRLPDLARRLESGGGGPMLVDVTLAALVLLPPALCIGATFPLAVRIAARDATDAGPASARVYSWNTVGAIVGAVGTGFLVLPWLGFENTLRAAVGTNLLLAAATTFLAAAPGRRLGWVAVAAAVGLCFLPLAPPWNLLRTEALGRGQGNGRVAFYSVGRGATVLVEDAQQMFRLRTNGLPEASVARPGGRAARARTSLWLGLLPVLARPELDSMFVVGLGGGVALEAVPPSVRRIEVVEIEPEVVVANRQLAPQRRIDPLADPRVTLHVNDARNTLLLLQPGSLDAVVAQASHPWTAAASHLYTREFFSLVDERLTDDGVFVQWIGLSFVDTALLRCLVATLLDVFPHVEVYQPGGAPGVLFLASRTPLDSLAGSARAVPRAPALFHELGLAGAEDVAAARGLDEAATRRFASGAPISRDERNLLQMRSPQLRGKGLKPAQAQRLFAKAREEAGGAGVPAGLDPLRLVRAVLDVHDPDRALKLAEGLSQPADRLTARALVALSTGRAGPARAESDAALGIDARSAEARATALIVRRRALAAEEGALPFPDPTPLERAVAAGWRAEAQQDWPGLRAHEEALAVAKPGDALFAEAARLRAAWRVAAGDAGLGREGLALIDQVIARGDRPELLVLRARAALAAGETGGALESLAELSEVLPFLARASTAPGPMRGWTPSGIAGQALELLAAVPGEQAPDADRSLVRARLEAVRRKEG